QSNHQLSLPSALDDEIVRLRLHGGALSWLLAGVDELGVLSCLADERRVHEPVVDDHVRLLEQLQPAPGQEPGIARPGSDEIHGARVAGPWIPLHPAARASARRRISPAPAASSRAESARPTLAASVSSPRISSRIHSLPSGRPT